ncbi:UDP-N-acetylglucosamine--N-acetylmuramyl-(pentapeptide) pyrophosphoryl-undecaprenol N-acetylglucosamine transferase [Candidatus Rickettsiella viridis]|uniref:UDP-N-acetylglucosamine--N-acetylmuramyl-(pentapeptide) pyrophosphoryl-undecaprenol N-acetylglucosamine transferase n=1 Tax=Candidatus Rickettsiella viridis TaxID=676208 RepID=A0A2Z5V6V4_9COXI|nr:undecaprenyldiphospho-muramoylpentapeptide beta-N-acetylglucosaminyltransferase [Candidatus Rickettsiella viridis]BBB14687.1 UDP-N-acetylglucosamine--N-acetylmuramyl-(pentapeptide) pyrophosphoryl-undecaprenol N-acetylglucosamine transferase [Candidatus Rickettsiella viridis]
MIHEDGELSGNADKSLSAKSILFTGGGSAGHVTPSFSLIQMLKNKGATIFYVGSKEGIERSLVAALNIPYYAVTTGKLRRYWSWQNFLTPFQLVFGVMQSFLLCRRLKPNIIFSKGGFVALPVVIAAWLNRIPVVIHESDLTPGLANRLSFPFAKFICVTFPVSAKYFKNKDKILVTGVPIRESLYQGDRNKGLRFCGFNEEKPVLLIMAGGLGSVDINNMVRRLLVPLTSKFQVIHLCGKGKLDDHFSNIPDYKQFEYLHEELADVLASADLVISRAGATSIYELIALKKPHILLPLSKQASRGDQIKNADYFAQQGLSTVLYAEAFSDEKFLRAIFDCYANLEAIKNKLANFKHLDSSRLIVDKLVALSK